MLLLQRCQYVADADYHDAATGKHVTCTQTDAILSSSRDNDNIEFRGENQTDIYLPVTELHDGEYHRRQF